MGFRELIKKVQHDSGFSDAESQEALEMMVESLAERLTETEREDFASQLPLELQAVVLGAPPASKLEAHRDIIEEFMDKERIEEAHAKKQVMSAWGALREAISEGEIRHIKSQLPGKAAAILY